MGSRPTIELDLESPEHAASWESTAAGLRSQCPMAWSTGHGGHWIAASYKDVLRIAQDTDGFTTGKTVDPVTGHIAGGTAIPPMPVARLVPAETNRPEWDGFRNLLNPRMGPRAAEAYRARARGYCDALIDQHIERGEMDVVDEFTAPLTGLVTLDLLGVPLGEWHTFSDPLHALTSMNKNDPAYAHALHLAGVMDQRIDEEIARRRAHPQDDMIGHLVTAEIDGRPLAHADIHQIIFNIVGGGVDTTTALTSNALVWLWKNPDERRRLIADRSLLPTAREEFIRYFSPLHGTVRTAQADAEVGGQAIGPNDRVFLMLASANRDPEMFDRPEDVLLDRMPNRHIGFGAGIHRCVGSFIARVMFDVMMETILDRIPDYVVHEDGAKLYPSVSPVNGWVNIPISFTPGPRSGLPDPDWLRKGEQ